MNYLCTMFYSTNSLKEIKEKAIADLSAFYHVHEAHNMVNQLIRHLLGMSRVDQQLDRDKRLSESEMVLFHKAMKRLLAMEPLQYVVGHTDFYGLTLEVGPGVLIPRPETEEMVHRILCEKLPEKISVLDMGTGSGCIALALKSERTAWEVMAVDVSHEAIRQAEKNSEKTGLAVDFRWCDILQVTGCLKKTGKKFDLIVSNPPYVSHAEKKFMAGNVLKYEPEAALFVPDEDPLLFYRQMITFSKEALLPQGLLFFEVNENFASQTAALLENSLFYPPEIIRDIRGKQRFIRARKRG